MTQAEVETECKSLREQVSRLRLQKEGERKHWLQWSRIAGALAVAPATLVILGSAFALANSYPTPPIVSAAGSMMLVLLFLKLAFDPRRWPAM